MQSHSPGEDRMDWMLGHWGAVHAGSPFQTEMKRSLQLQASPLQLCSGCCPLQETQENS